MHPHRGLALVAVLLAGLVTTFALPATAQGEGEDMRAKELYRNGERLYEEGLYEDAIVAWELAYELSKRPLLLYNMANALERIGQWDEALQRINQYRALAPEEERETLDRRMRAIERRLEQKRKADKETARDPESGQSSKAGPVRPTTDGPDNNNLLQLRPRPKTAQETPTGALVLIGFGGAGLTAGGILAGLAQQARSDAEAVCSGPAEPILCPTSARSSLNRDADLSIGADISLVAGGAAISAGVVLAILHKQGILPNRDRRVLVVPAAGPGQATLSIAGVF